MKNIYINGSVYTGELPLVQAFAEENGVFVFAGTDEDAKALAKEGDRITDLKGSFVCSGFNDSHMHLVNFGASLMSAQLAKHTASLADLLQCLRDFAAEHPVAPGQWLRGRGWNQDYFTDVCRMPDRWDLDQVSTEYPILITRCCGHALVVNSKALELLGLTADVQQPEGGAIGMENGQLDGRFFDNAMGPVYAAIPVPGKEDIKDMIRIACKALNSYGVTSCQSDDYCAYRAVPWQVYNQAYQELEASGELTVRVYEQCNFTTLPALQEFVEAGNGSGKGSDLFKIGPLKMLGDGALGARTAYLTRPYADAPSTCGLPVFTQQTLDEMIGYANEHGMHAAVHAIGDACLDQVLDAIEKALTAHPKTDHRHGVVHCQISRPDQLERIARLGLHIYAQSIFLDYDNHIVEPRVGKELAQSSYCWKTLMKNAARMRYAM